MAHCASGLVALEMLDDLLISGETAIILAGEKAFHPRVRVIQDTTVMSDGAVALLVGRGEGRIAVRATHAIHDGRFAISRGHRGEEPALPDNYVGFVGAHIRAALTRFGLAPGDLRLILPHNVNLVSWGAIAKTLGLPLTAVYTRNIPRYGHCFGADPLLNLMDAEADGLLAPGDRALCVSVGMGMSAAATLIDILPAPVPASIPAQRKDLSPCS
ncbi:MAG: 3-oxoacyl-[acyl-carrier-protein] synthase III C-terminal domain-containing protein [Defluviimonas denitrificans]